MTGTIEVEIHVNAKECEAAFDGVQNQLIRLRAKATAIEYLRRRPTQGPKYQVERDYSKCRGYGRCTYCRYGYFEAHEHPCFECIWYGISLFWRPKTRWSRYLDRRLYGRRAS